MGAALLAVASLATAPCWLWSMSALVTCPKALPMNIWLVPLWSDAAPKFQDDAERIAVTEAVIALRNGIVAWLALGRDHYCHGLNGASDRLWMRGGVSGDSPMLPWIRP